MTEYYTINSEKLSEITRLVILRNNPDATEEDVRGFILADWTEGEEHQRWLDTASPMEIVEWMEACTWNAMGGDEAEQ